MVKPGMMEMEIEIERTLIALRRTSMCTKWGRESNHAHLFAWHAGQFVFPVTVMICMRDID